jgi:hypothetical protein
MPDMIEARLHKLGKQLPGRLSIPGDLTANKNSFFIHFALREAVPDDHPVREIAAVLDLSWVYSELARSVSLRLIRC